MVVEVLLVWYLMHRHCQVEPYRVKEGEQWNLVNLQESWTEKEKVLKGDWEDAWASCIQVPYYVELCYNDHQDWWIHHQAQ